MNRSCIAFKMNFCDGGATSERVGFDGVCSAENLFRNVRELRRPWCSNDRCACKKFFGGRNFLRGEFVCYENTLLRDWRVAVGENTDGKPRTIRDGQENHLCILTTVRPNMPEFDRIIFAMFIMHEIFSGDDENAGYVEADDFWRLEFRPDEVHMMKFWDVYRNPNAPQRIQWGTGLFRYFDDALAVKFLTRAVEVKRGTPEETFAKEFLKRYPYK